MFGWVRPAGARTKKSIVWAGQRIGRVRLFTAVTLALITGTSIAVGAQWLLARVIATNQNQAAPIDITKLALTVVGGVGGAVALVVAYRRQRDLEQNRFVERFGAAAAQLGSTDVAVRIAGVYAMAGVADESVSANRQQCIDVLCGYLRLPYDTAHGGSGRTKLVTKTKTVGDIELEETTEYRQNDREVRQTIVRVIANHLRVHAPHDWSENTFDFRTAHLESANFGGARFRRIVHFDATTFSGPATFTEATFTNAHFTGATFSGNAYFAEAIFANAHFIKATFTDAHFTKATLGSANFTNTSFTGKANFREASFASIQFTKATFTDAYFTDATFTSYVDFANTSFTSKANFGKATFAGNTDFTKATFAGNTNFSVVTFVGNTNFTKATFAGNTNFSVVTFAGNTNFTDATFAGNTNFSVVTYRSAVNFRHVDFGTGTVTFDRPHRWDPPPMFDWDHDVALKPVNVDPQSWPPTVA